jgi:hypothetical protein
MTSWLWSSGRCTAPRFVCAYGCNKNASGPQAWYGVAQSFFVWTRISTSIEGKVMSKGQDSKKETKKPPGKTMKEKKADKKIKKDDKKK